MTQVLEDRPVAPVAEPQPDELATVGALARIEGRRLLRSPLVLVGVGLMLLALFGDGPWVSSIDSTAADAAFMSLLVAAMTLVASNLAAQRGRRSGAEELFAATPAQPRSRTGAHLLAVIWPAALSVVIPVLVVVTASFYGRPDLSDLADLAVGPLLVVGAGVLGVMLARWAPTPVAGPLACVAIIALEAFLTSPVVITSGWRYMAFWFDAGDIDLLPPRPALWHVVYLLALIAMAVVGSLLRHGLRLRLAVAGVVAIAVMVTSAVAQSRYVTDAAWARANGLLAHPEDHQICDDRLGVRYCTFANYRPLADRWAAVVEGVRERVPAEAWPAQLELSQRYTAGDLQYTPRAQLGKRIPALRAGATAAVAADGGALHPGRGWTDDGFAELSLAVGAASRAVGLPVAPQAEGVLCDTAGQARAVVALWLAAQATPAAGKALRQITENQVVRLDGGDSEVPHLLVTEDAVERAAAWGMVEVRHALALQRRPAAEVEAHLARSWDDLTDPASTTAALASALGLPAVPASELRTATAPGQDPGHGLRLGPPCRP